MDKVSKRDVEQTLKDAGIVFDKTLVFSTFYGDRYTFRTRKEGIKAMRVLGLDTINLRPYFKEWSITYY